MRGGLERGFFDDALDGGVGALARRTARAIGDRDESGLQRLQPLDRAPTALLPPRPSWAARIRTTRDRAPSVGDQDLAGSCRLLDFGRAFGGGEPEFDGELFRWSRRAGAMVSLPRGFRPAPANQPSHFAVGKAQAAMGIIVAQEFQLMRREIGDQKPPARRASRARLPPPRRRDRRDNAAPGGTARHRNRAARCPSGTAGDRYRPAAPAHA